MGKRKKSNLKWIKETLELDQDHRWQAPEGYKIFVAGRGAVRFDVPQSWHFEVEENSFWFADKKPPDDDCRLEVSFNHVPTEQLQDFPLAGILKKIAREDKRDVIETGDVVKLKRQTARIVWTQLKFIDHQADPREAYSRIGIGLGSGVQCLLTFEYWADQAEAQIPIWNTVMNSLTLGLYIRDPRTGLAFPD
ncbi:MAG: hypothetical protein HC873_11615 [Leptolyngbyaceae cyanobacterium SL_1_1]|nr:hypothetical protein [Leptolyngbyaceae cyanobacterium RM1_1_2]NJO10188.1 hypothetical protein [Leptolyngbyaceae cyanobacterium SL_1_1]